MFDFLPEKYDRKWFVIALVYFAVIFISIYSASALLLDNGINPAGIPSLVVVSLLIAFIICLFGFLNARLLFVCSSGGLFFAICMMILIFMQKGTTGWEDLIGIMSFYMMIVLGMGVGAVVELVAFIMRKLRKDSPPKRIKLR